MLSTKTLFQTFLAQTSTAPLMLEITHAKDATLYAADGKTYLDLISGISVSTLGHGNDKVLEAIKNQADRYLHLMVYGELVQSPQVELATFISTLLPFQNETNVFFTNSGSEAIEGAMKLAKRATKRSELIAIENAYHGSTHGPLSLSADPYYSDFYRPLLPDTKRIRHNHFEDLQLITNRTAAVFVETIMGEAGYIPPNPLWLSELKNQCQKMGALLVLDEIQCGMGRTGSMFAFEPYNCIPDILVLAKAFGAGMPLGAFIAPQKLMKSLSQNPILGHITTFGGHPVSCAAALAGIKEITRLELWKRAIEIENKFKTNLRHPSLQKISGKGAMLAIELESVEISMQFVQKALQKGILTDWFLYAPNKIRLSPPLILTDKEIQYTCQMFDLIAQELEL